MSPIKVILLFALFGLAAFCVFGFLATFEPLDEGSQIMWRAVYGLLGLSSVTGMALLLFGSDKNGSSK